jgi:hypothetical protein
MASLIEYLKAHKPTAFRPEPHYSEDGDCASFYFQDKDSYADRVDNFLTIFRSTDTDEMIGFEIKGVSQIMRDLGEFGVTVQDGGTEIGIIFAGYALRQRDSASRETLKRLGTAVRGRKMSIPADKTLLPA